MIILSPPIMACQIIDVSGPQYFNSDCRDLSPYQQSMSPSAGTCWLKTAKQRFRRRDSDLDPERLLFDDIYAEINDREC